MRVYPERSSQEAAMFAGTRRLLLVNLGQRRHLVNSIESQVDNPSRLAVSALALSAYPPYRSTEQLAEDTLVAAVEAAMTSAGGVAWTAAEFAALSAAVRDEVQPLARQAVKTVARTIVQLRELRRRLEALAERAADLPASSPLVVAVADVDAQLRSLVGPVLSAWPAPAGCPISSVTSPLSSAGLENCRRPRLGTWPLPSGSRPCSSAWPRLERRAGAGRDWKRPAGWWRNCG